MKAPTFAHFWEQEVATAAVAPWRSWHPPVGPSGVGMGGLLSSCGPGLERIRKGSVPHSPWLHEACLPFRVAMLPTMQPQRALPEKPTGGVVGAWLDCEREGLPWTGRAPEGLSGLGSGDILDGSSSSIYLKGSKGLVPPPFQCTINILILSLPPPTP